MVTLLFVANKAAMLSMLPLPRRLGCLCWLRCWKTSSFSSELIPVEKNTFPVETEHRQVNRESKRACASVRARPVCTYAAAVVASAAAAAAMDCAVWVL